MKFLTTRFHGAALLLVGFLTVASAGATAPDEMPPLLSAAAEFEAAVESAPPHLREGAGIYVLKADGYVRVRESQNGFTCIVSRELATSFEPECFDQEGTETILPVILYRAELRAQKQSRAQIDQAVAAGYASGKFRAPRRVGICYMLSPRNVVVMDRELGKVGPVGPHLMFYAPYLTNADFGATNDFASHFIIADEGSPMALIIVPIHEKPVAHQHQ